MSIVEKCDFVQVGGSLEHITVFILNSKTFLSFSSRRRSHFLFVFMLYDPVNNFSFMSGQFPVFLGY